MTRRRDALARLLGSEVFPFLLVGGSAALLYIAFATLLEVHAGLARPWASAIAYGSMIPVAYMAQKTLAFRSTARHATAFPRYLATQLVALATASLVSGAFLGLPPPLVYFIAGLCAAVVSFLMLKFWGFASAPGNN